MQESIIVARDIFKSFGAFPILKGVDLAIERGSITAITGASGAGKTTLLQTISTLEKPDSGTISIDGTSIHLLKGKGVSKFRNEKIGFVFQFHHLLPELSTLENIMLPALIKGVSIKEAQKRGKERMEQLGLAGKSDQKPATLSGGEKQRAAVARALINNPPVVFADEPTGNLDSKNSQMMQSLFEDLRKELGITIVLVTHDEAWAARCDNHLHLVDGKIA